VDTVGIAPPPPSCGRQQLMMHTSYQVALWRIQKLRIISGQGPYLGAWGWSGSPQMSSSVVSQPMPCRYEPSTCTRTSQ
jgi:hypothetical protein